MYIVFGSVQAPMVLPAAFQAAGAFGVDIGGVDPAYFSVSLEAELDSWLTIGATDGSLGPQLSAIGIDDENRRFNVHSVQSRPVFSHFY